MGYNTTVVVLNDALDIIAKDPEFGAKLADAIARVSRKSGPIEVAASSGRSIHCNAATVIETHHADYEVLVSVGGNIGRVVEK